MMKDEGPPYRTGLENTEPRNHEILDVLEEERGGCRVRCRGSRSNYRVDYLRGESRTPGGLENVLSGD